MHPTTLEFLVRDRIADVYRQTTQPHVPETGPAARPEPGRRAPIGVAIAALGRLAHRPFTSEIR